MFEDIEIKYKQVAWPLESYPTTVTLAGKKGIKVSDTNSSPTGGHSGIDKTVFVFDNYVVKFGGFSEVERIIESQDQKHFAEVVYASIDRKWYVQKRVKCFRNAVVTDANWGLVKSLCLKYNLYDISIVNSQWYGEEERFDIGHNWTVDLDGNEVIYDY